MVVAALAGDAGFSADLGARMAVEGLADSFHRFTQAAETEQVSPAPLVLEVEHLVAQGTCRAGEGSKDI